MVTMKGKSLTLVGRKINIGMHAPNFKVVNSKLEDVNLDDFIGKIKVITSFISLDTPVCDLQVKEFNKRALGLSSDVVILGISKDLPFSQQKFCALNNIKNISVLSDYKSSSFGINYGLLIKELNLLARAAIIIDINDVIRYIQIVPEITNAPNYEDILNNLNEVIRTPSSPACELLPSKCIPCEEGTPSLEKKEIEQLMKQATGWQLVEDKKLVREFKFKDFVEAKYFLDLLAILAEEQGHHPNFTLIYNKLKVSLTTHASNGLTENDFVMARIINDVGM